MKPNILLITTDQHHYKALGAKSPKLKTPNLDRLAKMGTTFERAYCPNPTCTPTRSSMITGMYPSTHGAYTLGTKLAEDIPTIGQYLHSAGYRTSLIGKAHFQPLKSTESCPSVEAYPTLRNLDFWRNFNQTHTPWYGFDHVETARMHTDEGHTGQHYAIWMEENGLKNWRAYFQCRHDTNQKDTPEDDTLSPPRVKPDYGWRDPMSWKLPEEHHYTRWIGLRTIAMIEEASRDKTPFFCWSSYPDPHPPYCVPEPWASMYDPDDMDSEIGEFVEGEFDAASPMHRMTRDPNAKFDEYKPDGFGSHGCHSHNVVTREQMRKAMACYYGMISFIDHWVGQTLDALERTGQLASTLIVFTTDHGHFLGQHGLIAKGPFHYEDVIRVPFIAALPGTIPAGTVSNQLVSLVDLAPTFLDLVGMKTPGQMQGTSQLSNWANPQAAGQKAVFVENHHNGAAVHLRTMVTKRYKITLWRDRGQDWGELYDLKDDPNELKNRYNDPNYAAIRTQMLEQFIQSNMAIERTSPRVWHA